MFHSSELCFYQIECHGRELDEETGQLKPLDGNNNVGLEQKKKKKELSKSFARLRAPRGQAPRMPSSPVQPSLSFLKWCGPVIHKYLWNEPVNESANYEK